MTKASLTEIYLPYPGRGERRVRVYVPAHEENARLPVIYMTDGQNLFDEESAGWGCWHTMDAVEENQRNGGSGAVIAGIDHGGIRRDNELTPGSMGELIAPQEMENFTAPEGEIFDSFVVDTVMPAVEERFPVLRDAAHTAVCGSSSGGLQAFFTGLSHTDRFSAIGAFSPALLLYPAEDVREWVYSKMAEGTPYIYLYSGRGDGLEERIFKSTRDAAESLRALGYPADRFCEVTEPGFKHNEAAWDVIFRDFLKIFLK